jgi:hypothetical protein
VRQSDYTRPLTFYSRIWSGTDPPQAGTTGSCDMTSVQMVTQFSRDRQHPDMFILEPRVQGSGTSGVCSGSDIPINIH